ncbi:MAG: metallophosphoesterase [Clostridia bacterium]|nr:metallophosphoesterase [Clostridia bacterium]
MRKWTAMLMVLFALNGLPAAAAGSAVRLAVASDLHYIAPELTDHGAYFTRITENGDGKMMRWIEQIADAWIDAMLSDPPDAVILSGDLSFNGAVESHRALAAKLEKLTASGIRVFVMPGNHDLCNRDAARFSGDSFKRVESADPAGFREIYSAFGYADADASDSGSLSYMAELNDEWSLLFLDANTPEAPGPLRSETLEWAEKQLSLANREGKSVLSVTHQNLLAHNAMFQSGFIINNAADLAALFERYGVRLNLSGHMHLQHIARTDSGLCDIATSSLAVSPNQYGMLEIRDGLARYRTVQLDVSGWARKNGYTDPELLNFAECSREFFKSMGLRKSLASIPQSEADARELAETLGEINALYFSGRTDRIAVSEEWIARWDAFSPFTALYLRSILPDLGVNMCETELLLKPAAAQERQGS